MINNTNPQRGHRISAKSIDAQFRLAMQKGLNCSPFEAQIMVEKVHELYGPLFDTSLTIQPGQVQICVVDTSVPPGVPLQQAAQKLVTIGLLTPEDVDFQQQQGIPALRRKRLVRICEEAFQQGGLFTLEDLSFLFNCSLRTLVYDLAALRRQNLLPPLRSTVKDMGRALSHRRQILALWLEGQEYSEIARRSHHTVQSVSNYVEKFKRCVALRKNQFDIPTTAFLARLSIPLVQEFENLYAQVRPAAHRQQELKDFFKKSLPADPVLARRRCL